MSKQSVVFTQQLDKGILGGPYCVNFSVERNSALYDISIEQCVIRETTISSTDAQLNEILAVFNTLDQLIMLGEGHFIPIVEAKNFVDGKETDSSVLKDSLEKRLKMYHSADFTKGSQSTFLSFDKYISKETFMKWVDISDELDILHNMVLYSMADTGMPIDCKCVYLTEAFKALAELAEKYDSSFSVPGNRNRLELKTCLHAFIEKYGNDIFDSDFSMDINKVIQTLTNSRNRIAHIKSKQDKLCLNGPESVLYSVKLSFLYRTVLLTLLGVDYSLYSSKVISSIESWDKWNNILDEFLQKLL